MIYITGDTHGFTTCPQLRRKALEKTMSESGAPSYLIVAGDFGVPWSLNPDDRTDLYWKKVFDGKPFITCAVPGNHENYEAMSRLPLVSFCGGQAYRISEKMYYLRRGYGYSIDGKRVLALGGAVSTDKERRKAYLDWWPEEEWSAGEQMSALERLSGQSFDIAVSHTAPVAVVRKLCEEYNRKHGMYELGGMSPYSDSVSRFTSELAARVQFRHFYFGHFHIDMEVTDRYTAIYNKIAVIA